MPTADLVITGAHVRTLDPERPYATAVAVHDGLIAAVGDAADVRDWRGPGTETVDLGGGRLVPGLVDSHSHPVWGLDMATGIDLTAVRDLDGLRAALTSGERVDGWVIGYGLDHNVFGGRTIDRVLVEDILLGAPAFLRLYDGHSALVSGAALKAAGITGPRAFEQRSHLAVDADGRLTGHLVEHAAMELVQPVMPRPSYAERRSRLAELLGAMAATGLTGAHVMDLGDLDLVGAVAEESVLPLRLRFAPWCMPGADADDLAELVALQRRDGRHWRVGGVKFFMDGTVEGGTAWLDHPDCHGQGTDAFWPDPGAYSDALRHLHRAGCVRRPTRSATPPCGTSSTPSPRWGPAGGSRTGWSTSSRCRTSWWRGSRRWGSSPPCSPRTPTTPGPTCPTSGRRGSARSVRYGPGGCAICGTAGAVVALGSDWPIAHYDARAVLATAREPRGAASSGAGLTGMQALEGCTSHAALAAGEADVSGRIAVGFRADLTALGVDPVEAPADEVAEAPVRLTVTGGHVVHRGL